MSGGANVTVTIGAAFAGSFKSVLGEADRDLKGFGKRTARSMKGADRAAAGLGKAVVRIGKAAQEAHSAIGATAILAACQATAASCATVAGKDFSPKITVQGGGTTAAAKERSSFSD